MKIKLLCKTSISQEIYALRCLRSRKNMLEKELKDLNSDFESTLQQILEFKKINSSLKNEADFLEEKIKDITTNIAILAGINYLASKQ